MTAYLKPTVYGDDDAWGGILNDTIDDIAADMDKGRRLLSSGVVSSLGVMDIPIQALDPSGGAARVAGVDAWEIKVGNIRPQANTQVFCRMGFIDHASVKTGATDYEFVRRDLSNQSGGTQTFAGSAGAPAILLSDLMAALIAGSEDGYDLSLLLTSFNNANQTARIAGTLGYKNAGGYMAISEFTGRVILPNAAGVTLCRIGGLLSGSYTAGLLGSWALYSVPGL